MAAVEKPPGDTVSSEVTTPRSKLCQSDSELVKLVLKSIEECNPQWMTQSDTMRKLESQIAESTGVEHCFLLERYRNKWLLTNKHHQTYASDAK